jgi:hypothetical protein
VARHALPDPEGFRSELDHADAAPQTELQQTIAAVWKEMLNLDRVGIHSNFFDLGGHSLLLARVHEKLIEVTRREIPIIAMFQFPTISSLANHLSQEQAAPAELQESRDRAERRKQLMAQAQLTLRSRAATDAENPQ